VNTFAINVQSVNSAPAFSLVQGVGDLTEDSGCVTKSEFAFQISPGPAKSTTGPPCMSSGVYNDDLLGCNENSQDYTFKVTQVGGLEFDYIESGPTIDKSGTLSLCLKDSFVCGDGYSDCVTTWSVVLVDDGGTENGGVNISVPITFEMNVAYLNDPPSFNLAQTSITRNEDSGLYTLPAFATDISFGEENEAYQTLTFIITCNEAVTGNHCGLFQEFPSITPDGNLSFVLADYQYGLAMLDVYLRDSGGTDKDAKDSSPVKKFNVTVLFVNHAPSFDLEGSLTVLEASTSSSESSFEGFARNILPGPPTESTQTVTFNVTQTSGSASLFAAGGQPVISPSGTLNFTLSAYQHGSATFSVVLKDDGGTLRDGEDQSGSQTFTITVSPVNNRPTFDLLTPTVVSSGTVHAFGGELNSTQLSLPPGSAVSFQNMSVSVRFVPGVNVVETRTVFLHNTTSGILEMDAQFSSLRMYNATASAANGLFYPRDDSPKKRFTYVKYGSDASLFYRDLTQNIFGPCTTPFWVLDSRHAYSENYGGIWRLERKSGGTGYIDGDIIITSGVGRQFLGTFKTTAAGQVSEVHIASPGMYYSQNQTAVLVYRGTTHDMQRSISDITFDYSAVQQSEHSSMWGSCASGGTMTTVSTGAGGAGTGFSAAYTVQNDKLVLNYVNHGTGYVSRSNFTFRPSAATCRCGSGIMSLEVETQAPAQYAAFAGGSLFTEGVVGSGFAGTFTVTSGVIGDITITSRGGNYTQVPNIRLQFDDRQLTSRMCTYRPSDGKLECEGGAILNISVGVAPDACMVARIAVDASVEAFGDTSLLHLCDNTTDPTRTTHRWLERDGSSGWREGATVSAASPVIASSEYTVSKPGYVTVWEDSDPYERQLATNVIPEPLEDTNSQQTLTFSVEFISGQSELFSLGPSVSDNGTLSFSVAANGNGLATYVLSAQDNGGTSNGGIDTSFPFSGFYESSWSLGSWACSAHSCSQRFSIVIEPVNDHPLFELGIDPGDVWEDSAGPRLIHRVAYDIFPGPADESPQTLTFVVSVEEGNDLFEFTPEISSNGTLNFTLAPSVYGVATLVIHAVDDGGVERGGDDTSPTQTFYLDVKYVNHAPLFTMSSDNLTVLEDAEAYEKVDFATGISEGLDNEDWQNVTFVVKQASGPTGLFESAPSITPEGVLTFKVKQHQWGTASCSIVLEDDGGTEREGKNVSVKQVLVIDVKSVNDAPTFNLTASVVRANQNTKGTITYPRFAFNMSKGAPNEFAQVLTFNVVQTGGNTTMFDVQPAINPGNGALTFTLAVDECGEAQFAVTLEDDGGTVDGGINVSITHDLHIVVDCVNQRPKFNITGDVTVDEVRVLQDTGIYPFVLNASTGPDIRFERPQILSYIIEPARGYASTANDLFAVKPWVDTSNGTLRYTLRPFFYGKVVFIIAAEDSGGTEHGGVNRSVELRFTFTVRYVNDAPTFDMPSRLLILEDTQKRTWPMFATNISAGPPNEPPQLLTFNVTYISGVRSLFLEPPQIDVDGTLIMQLYPSAWGDAYLEVSLRDNGGLERGGIELSQPHSLLVSVVPVNDAPTFRIVNPIATVLETKTDEEVTFDTFVSSISPSWQSDRFENGLQDVSFEVDGACSDTLFVSCPEINATGALRFTLRANQFGLSNFTAFAIDNGNSSGPDGEGNTEEGFSRSRGVNFSVSVLFVNREPTFTVPNEVVVLEDSPPYNQSVITNVSMGPSNPEEAKQTGMFSLTFRDGNANIFTVPPRIIYDRKGAHAHVMFTTATLFGTARYNVTLRDNGGTARNGRDTSDVVILTIRVRPVNDAPTFSLSWTQTTVFQNTLRTLTYRMFAVNRNRGAPDEGNQNLTFAVTFVSGTPSMFAVEPAISASTGDLSFHLAGDKYGVAKYSAVLRDDGGTDDNGQNASVPRYFDIIVEFVNQPPRFNVSANVTVSEVSAVSSVSRANFATNIMPGPSLPMENNQTINFLVEPAHGSLAAADELFLVKPTLSANGTLSYVLRPYYYGTVIFNVRGADNGGTERGGVNVSPPQAFTFQVTPINHPPLFVVPANYTALEDDGRGEYPGFVTNISVGPGKETPQDLTFDVIVTNRTAMFTSPVQIRKDGTLIMRLAKDMHGTATLNITLRDDSGGDNISPPKIVTVTVVPVNDPPTFSVDGPIIWWENVTGSGNTIMPDLRANRAPYFPAKTYSLIRGGTRVVDVGFARNILAGPGTENAEQALSFVVSVLSGNMSMFEQAPQINSSTGTLTFTTSRSYFVPDSIMETTLVVRLVDSGGTSNGGRNTSVDTVNITVALSPAQLEFDLEFPMVATPTAAMIEAYRLEIAKKLGIDTAYVVVVSSTQAGSPARRRLLAGAAGSAFDCSGLVLLCFCFSIYSLVHTHTYILCDSGMYSLWHNFKREAEKQD
jgi:hypothetical protein